MFLHESCKIDNPCSRELDGIAGLPVGNVETERGDDFANDSQINAAGRVEDEVEPFSAFEPSLCRHKGSGNRGIHSNGLDIDAKLSR